MSLDRFIHAQEKTFAGALAELKAGKKTGHWIWWIFPQLRGLGKSEYSIFYGLADEAEARGLMRGQVVTHENLHQTQPFRRQIQFQSELVMASPNDSNHVKGFRD